MSYELVIFPFLKENINIQINNKIADNSQIDWGCICILSREEPGTHLDGGLVIHMY